MSADSSDDPADSRWGAAAEQLITDLWHAYSGANFMVDQEYAVSGDPPNQEHIDLERRVTEFLGALPD